MNREIHLRVRDTFSRHTLHGLNVFLNEMFQQFPLILGIRQLDYMTGSSVTPPLITSEQSMLELAATETARVEVVSLEKIRHGLLSAKLRVTNMAGHYLPSGVGFRRVFIEFLVKDANDRTLWASGRTNSLGAILDGTSDRVLPSEQPVKILDAPFQPHYQVIDSGEQVQIYQELVKDSEGQLTTSFLRRINGVKNNRLRPKGYDPAFFANNASPYIRELAETQGRSRFDPYYTDPSLTDADEIEYRVRLDKTTLAQVNHVTVTLYNQSIPPFYLQQRFRDASRGPAEKGDIERFFYVTNHLNLETAGSEGQPSPLKDWKPPLARSSRRF